MLQLCYLVQASIRQTLKGGNKTLPLGLGVFALIISSPGSRVDAPYTCTLVLGIPPERYM